jgi:hypothetical protein
MRKSLGLSIKPSCAIFALCSFLQVAQDSRYLRYILAPSNTGSSAPVVLFGLQFVEFNTWNLEDA